MKNKWLLFLLFFCTAAFLFPGNPWGNLKKIHFYDSVKNDAKVLEHLEKIDCTGIGKEEKKEIASRLITFGDYYFSKENYVTAEAFYKKVINFSPGYWYLYNKLEEIDREKGSSFINFNNVFSQLLMMLNNFDSSFLIFNSFFNIAFFAGLFVFFLFAVFLFIKYFKLAGNDLLVDEEGAFSMKKTGILFIILLWPVLVLTGWMVYPFLITGFLWLYLNDNERKTISYLLIAVGVLSILYSFNLMMERSAVDRNFKTVQKVYAGHLFEREAYEKFDNELKVAQAFSYYQNKEYETALSILLSTGKEYKNRLKYDLMGSLYHLSENYSESINHYVESLRLDDSTEATLNNFTLTLLKNNREDVFESYKKRYPKINEYKKKVTTLQAVKLSPTAFLWKRLLYFSSERFSVGVFVKNLLGEFLKLPIIYFILLFFIYFFGVKKFAPAVKLGGSTYCSKCTKIIKEASVHKSYKLCDECYQLFLIKDVIFLEAKILKEKELNKKFRKKYVIGLLFSLLIPGLNLNYNERNRMFIIFSMMFYFLLGFSVVGSLMFSELFSTAPIFLNVIGMAAFVFYFIVNLISVFGDYDGF